ncbi:nucleotidyltransferase domain-containing protein [Candidatus Woesearchaeota archaeon]|nr:nucleotidyltransferase domain-containing protein [Candidatus Woesearchaeota archaeon]
MAKKSKKEVKKEAPKEQPQAPAPAGKPDISKLPKEVQEKLKKIKVKLDKFKKKTTEKFDKYIMGISLLPPPRPKEGEEKKPTEEISVLVLVDDTEQHKMSKGELKQRLVTIINEYAKEIDPNIKPDTILLSELWQSCYDGKYDLLRLIALGAPVYDVGMLAAIKLAEIHKNMILKKFEKYIVSYVLAGSLTQGRATPKSDIDVWIVIDDTDVKKMTRAELKDKLRAIIIGMGIEAGEMTGIKNKLNIQVYILTDFWDSLKEANPVIFTLLRDGVPFYDRGVFMPWKLLLKMGKIKPSAEAIDMFMGSGEQMLRRVRNKLVDMGMEDVYYAILTPSQAAIMLYGLPPPAPFETPDVLSEVFVKKEKILEAKYVEILRNTIKVRKEIEHGDKKEISGKEVDDLLTNADKFLKRIRRLFTQIEKQKEEETMVHIYDSIITVIRDILKLEGVEKVADAEVIKMFKEELVDLGKIPEKFLRILNDIAKAKKDYDDKKLTKHEVEKVKKESGSFIRFMVEYLQRKRGRELEKTKIRVKHGNRYGEVLLLGDIAFIIHDIDKKDKEISKAKINLDGSLGTTKDSNLEELEKYLAKIEIPAKTFIKAPIFENLEKIFGKDVEILVTY